jgi:hypothetical protein
MYVTTTFFVWLLPGHKLGRRSRTGQGACIGVWACRGSAPRDTGRRQGARIGVWACRRRGAVGAHQEKVRKAMRLARHANTPTRPSADPCSPTPHGVPDPGDKSPYLLSVAVRGPKGQDLAQGLSGVYPGLPWVNFPNRMGPEGAAPYGQTLTAM